jgi:hypothetical protein
MRRNREGEAMTEREEVRSDVLSDMLIEFGVRLSREDIDQLANDFYGHLMMEREQDSYQFIGPAPCAECAKKKKRIDQMETREAILESGIKRLARMPDDSSVSTEYGRVSIQEPMR